MQITMTFDAVHFYTDRLEWVEKWLAIHFPGARFAPDTFYAIEDADGKFISPVFTGWEDKPKAPGIVTLIKLENQIGVLTQRPAAKDSPAWPYYESTLSML